jgi:hypothetical protein
MMDQKHCPKHVEPTWNNKLIYRVHIVGYFHSLAKEDERDGRFNGGGGGRDIQLALFKISVSNLKKLVEVTNSGRVRFKCDGTR